MAWATQKTLWEDTIEKAPGRARPYQNLARGYYERIGKMDKALELYEKARWLRDWDVGKAAVISLNNMGYIYSHEKHDYEKAIGFFKRALNTKHHHGYG